MQSESDTQVLTPIAISPEDQEHLEAVEQKLVPLKDRVANVAMGLTTGLYLYGEGGIGKTHHVQAELDRRETPYLLSSARITGKGLFMLLKKHPDELHILEDCESLCRDSNAQGVLRAALWGPVDRASSKMIRKVTWHSGLCQDEFLFFGQIIMVMNRSLDDLPELRAVATRINPIQLTISSREIAAVMRSVAIKGYQHGSYFLDPVKCLEVAEFIIEEAPDSLDMRILFNGFNDRIQEEEGQSIGGWRSSVRSRLFGQARTVGLSRTERVRREAEIARRLAAMPRNDRIKAWAAETGKSEDAFYRRLKD